MRRAYLVGFLGVLLVLIAGCGGGGDSSSDGGFQFEESASDEAGHYAEVWCRIDGSMTRDEVIQLMGEPTSEFDASEAKPQSQWDAGPFEYTVFYDETGHVDQAYVNELSLPPSEKPFPCEEVRFY